MARKPAMLSIIVFYCASTRAFAAAGEHALARSAELQAISFDAALAWAEQAPELRSRPNAIRSLDRQRSQVTSLPADLTLSAEAGPRGSKLEPAGRVSANQMFSLAGLGDARRSVLRKAADTLQAEQRSVRWMRRNETARAWLELCYAHKAFEVAQRELALARDLARVTNRGVELGELTTADGSDAAAYAAEAELNLLSAEGALADARFELTRSVGISDRVLDAAGEAPALQLLAASELATLHAKIRELPSIAELMEQVAWLQARKTELRANQSHQLGLGVVVDWTEPRAVAGLAAVSLTFPLRDRSVRERAELDANAEVVRGRIAENQARGHVELDRLVHDAEHARKSLEYTDQQLMPAVEMGLRAREALFRSGEGSALELILARRAALVLRVRRERVHFDCLIALARLSELARAVGGSP